MTGWIVLGVCSLAVLVLVFSVLPLLRRLSQLHEIQGRLRRRAEQMKELEPAVVALRRRAAEMEHALRMVQQRAEALQARCNAG